MNTYTKFVLHDNSSGSGYDTIRLICCVPKPQPASDKYLVSCSGPETLLREVDKALGLGALADG